MPRQNTWTNADGLVVGFGTHSVDDNVPAEDSATGTVKVLKMVINGVGLEDTVTVASLPPQAVYIKRGSIIQRAKFEVIVPFAGATATLDIGTFSSAAVADVANGIDAAIAVTAIDAIGEIVVCDGTLVNGAIAAGATSNSDVTFAASFNTAAFTAGRGVLVVEYVEPDYNQPIAA